MLKPVAEQLARISGDGEAEAGLAPLGKELLHRGGEVGSGGPGAGVRAAGFLPAGPGEHQDAPPAEAGGCLDIAQPVADPPAPLEVEAEVRGGPAVEHEAGLPALARAGDLGQMGAVVVGVDTRGLRLQQLVHPADGGLVVIFGEEPARDARLVGHNDGGQARVIELAHRLRRAGQEAHVAGVAQVVPVLDQCAVAIEEHRRPAAHS